MLNRELFMCALPAFSWLMFSLGGTQISDKVPGWKGWRRFILPLGYLIAVVLGVVWIKACAVAFTACLAYSLPYGDKTPWPAKFLVGCSYALISWPLGFSWWNLFTALGFITLFALSNTKLTERIFIWKICEGSFGLLVGIQVAFILMK